MYDPRLFCKNAEDCGLRSDAAQCRAKSLLPISRLTRTWVR